MNEAQAMMQRHEQQIEMLMQKYISGLHLRSYQKKKDVWERREWYAHRIKELSINIGRTQVRQSKCKYNSATYQRYQAVENDLEMLVDNLIIDLNSLS